MNDATAWWILAGLLVAVELGTGSFYLLMLALGAAAGALGAHGGLSPSTQIVLAALTGAVTTFGWYRYRRQSGAATPDVEGNRDVNLDVGETVQVQGWGPQGQTKVMYRGTQWDAHYQGQGVPQPGPHRIAALRGNTLELTRSN
ncbi:membrane protein implicated in regulation of membrane protease activity [Inhella inkyongensis]|uniref:Membrane protein implicated in regulation of membrane protease activity n=1 Tax=Inhella inkyongensis TaxID=392593 RepID=A0A840S636_9BURK|nr:NfeD family protein [Inhella inkyongensis]MBB5203950.1 membrane protein implicated in regulation of membrane protease activity [Inhella inkyongensis]